MTTHLNPIRHRRLQEGLSQEQLAIAASCSLPYLRMLEGDYQPDWAASPKARHVLELLGLTEADIREAHGPA